MERQRLKDVAGMNGPFTAGQILRYAQDDGLIPSPAPQRFTTLPPRVNVVTPPPNFKSNPSATNTNIPANSSVIAPDRYKNPPPNPLSRSSPLTKRIHEG